MYRTSNSINYVIVIVLVVLIVMLSDGGGCSEFPNPNGYHVK
jgi:hypothetical protein